MEDQYREAGEFLDIMSRDAWRALGPALADALRQAGVGNGPVIDVGAGSGLATVTVARTLPDAEILAVEPSPALRAVLLAKLADDTELAQRVTVLDSDLQHAALPERFGAVVAMNMIGHLEPGDRRAFWALLAQRLTPGAHAVLNLQAPDRPTPIPESRFCAVLIGHRTYEGWGRAEPLGTEAVIWHMRYRILEGDTTVAERAVDYRWWVFTEEQLRAELAEQDLNLRPLGPPELRMYAISTRPITSREGR